MKRIVSFVLAVVFILGTALPARAALMSVKTYDYTDADSGNTFSHPGTWKPVSVKNSLVKVKFTTSDKSSPVMQYGSADLWGSLSAADQKSLPREEFDNGQLSKADVAELVGTKSSRVKIVTLNGKEFFRAEVDKTKTAGGISVTLTSTYWLAVSNGWLYLYLFSGDDSHKLYKDFETMVGSSTLGVDSPDGSSGQADLLGGSYTGDMKQGKPHGEGTVCWEYSSYTGSFKNGYPSGCGTFYYADGTCLEGDSWGWSDTVSDSWVDRKGAEMIYTGMMLCGEFAGYGYVDFSSGGSYQGEFFEHGPQGWGIYTYRALGSIKESEKESFKWKTVHKEKRLDNTYYGMKIDKKWQGFGIGILKSGYCYCGEIVNDYRDGHGELYTKKDQLERWGIYKKGNISKTYKKP